jgi:hypothetical protein
MRYDNQVSNRDGVFTAMVKDDTVYVQAGAGIVADSVPEFGAAGMYQ